MYLFYQQTTVKDPETGFGESWKTVKDTPEARQALAKKCVEMVSMLAISSTDNDADYEQLKYRGDLYFDIDNEDLSISIDSTQQIVNKLKDLGVHNITVYLSGKKGFHVTVPSKVFFNGGSAGIKWLPYIYGHMAINHFAVEGLDLNVYSGGKGRLWRQPNVKRRDNGQYKVPIRLEDLAGLDVESYKNLASQPNTELEDSLNKADPTFSLELSSIFEDSAVIIRKEQESKETYRFETTPELEMLSEVPGCIAKLADGLDVKDGTNFNRAAMNLAGYLKSANKIGSDIADDLIGRMSSHNNFGSATYTSERARRSHIKSAIGRARHDKSMGCNPAYILSTVERCGGCVICNGTLSKDSDKKKADGKGKPGHMDEDGLRHNVYEIGLAYYKDYGPKSAKALTTFIIEPVSSDIFFNKEHSCFRRESLKCVIRYTSGQDSQVKSTRVTIEEDAWDSPALFKKQFKGIDNVAITCSEDDLADLRHYIMSKHNDIDNSIRTATMGMDVKEIPVAGDKISKVLVYTEPGYTASGNDIRIPVHYDTDERETVIGTPCIHKAPDLSGTNHDDDRVARDIFNVNEAWVCAAHIGWMASTALKPHIISINNEFPLFAVTGRPGTGKTTISTLMADLAGCTYGQTGEPPTATSSPAFIERYIAGSTSTPRLIDEMNQQAVRNNPKLIETVKGSWNGLEVGKGSISGGATKSSMATRSVKLTGPVLYISEQPQQDDALRQRSVEVMLTMKMQPVSPTGEHIPRSKLKPEVIDCVDAFEFLTEHEQRNRLRGIGKAIIHQSLSVPKSWVRERMGHYAKEVRAARCHGRQKYGWRVILMGLDLYQLALKEQCDIDVTIEVDKAKRVLLSRLLDTDVTDNGKDNCNNEVLQFIAGMSERSAISEIKGDSHKITLDRSFEYRKTDSELYIQIETIWPTISGHARSTGTQLKYQKCDQFISAVRTEEYFVDYRNGWLRLELASMVEAGIKASNFYTEDEFETKEAGHTGIF